MALPDLTHAVYSKLLDINPTHAKALERLAELEAGQKGQKSPARISQLLGKKR
jgi:hypothetical protein